MHKLAALKTPTAESLFFLLYDVAQWLKNDRISFDIVDFAERQMNQAEKDVNNAKQGLEPVEQEFQKS